MPAETFKIMIFLKRRPGMSLAAFREYYEGVHARLCLKYAVGALRYVRRYVQPLPLPGSSVAEELDFDVVTEIWFDNRAIYDKVVEAASLGLMPAEVLEDEERLFDRPKSRFATVVECDSELPPPGASRG
jgi:hypothetical protein